MDAGIKQILDEVSLLSKQVSSLDNKVSSLDGKVSSLDGKVSSLDGKVSSLDGKVSSLDGKVSSQGVKLEQVASDVKAVAEGHSVLLNAINRVDNKLEGFMAETKQNFEVVGQELKEIKSDLKEHSRQTLATAHVSV